MSAVTRFVARLPKAKSQESATCRTYSHSIPEALESTFEQMYLVETDKVTILAFGQFPFSVRILDGLVSRP